MLSIFAFAAAALDPAFAELRTQDARLATIAWRLQTANAPLCPKAEPLAGLSLEALSLYPAALRGAARRQFGLSDRVSVAAVATGGAAQVAGIEVGDAIVAINARATPMLAEDRRGYDGVAKAEAELQAALRSGSASVRIERTSTMRDVRIDGVRGCTAVVQIVPGNRLNAQADGYYVQINTAMVAFTQNDDELAAITAHELAHNILGHRAKATASKQAEYEADRLSVWLVARAGYDVDTMLPFWTRLEKRTSLGIFADGTHPSAKRRLAALAQAVAVLVTQRTARQDLIPPAQ